jgi:beta-glucosidase
VPIITYRSIEKNNTNSLTVNVLSNYLMKNRFNLIFLVLLAIFSSVSAQKGPVYLDPSQPIKVRVKDMISKFTLQEKVDQLMYNSPAIPRLDIPAYNWWNEALHGVGRSGVATVFPQAIGLGATFDPQLAFRVSTAISDEARAMFNAAVSHGYRQKFGGLTFWTPNINIFRDPRWGRGQETYGEDPFLTSSMGVAFVKGLQGDDPKYLKVAACAKHFAVHSGPERLRHVFNAVVSPKDLRETYLPAFKSLVDAGVEAVMCAYNSTNGQPCCGNNYLIDTILRKEWGFKGHVVSDCWAITDFYEGHKVVANVAQAAAMALKTGVNLNCGNEFPGLLDAVKQRLVTEAEIDSSLSILLKTKFKLGLFDPRGSNPYNSIPVSVINSAEHRQLAREVAVKSMVLLKNDGVLPLKNDLAKYFITGPNAGSVDVLIGNYFGVNTQFSTYIEGIASGIQPGSQLEYRPGILLDRDNLNPIDWTTDEAKASDAIIVVLGISGLIEGEEGESIASSTFGDRLDYNLPKNQIDFLKKLREGNKKPIITIITGGSPMNLSEVHELSDAVLLAWYPGEEGGNAAADLIFGKVSPSGKLPITFPKSLDQLPAYENYAMAGRTYRYMTAEPMYPFGYGLSYGKFDYSNLKLSATSVKKNQPVNVDVTLTNSGNMEAEEVAQLYITNLNTKISVPLFSLKAFKRIKLKPNESTLLHFTVTPEMMSYVDNDGKSVLSAGDIKVTVGGASPLKRSVDLGISKPLEATFTLK